MDKAIADLKVAFADDQNMLTLIEQKRFGEIQEIIFGQMGGFTKNEKDAWEAFETARNTQEAETHAQA